MVGVAVGVGVGVGVAVAVGVGVAVVVGVGVAVVVAVAVAVGIVVAVAVAVGIVVAGAVGVAMTAAVYMPTAKQFHANLDCDIRLRRRGVVGDSEWLSAHQWRPCRKCWAALGYRVTTFPEPWEEAL